MKQGDILQYLKIFRKWWWVIVLLFVATVGTMVAIALLTETQYEASLTILVSAPPPQEVPLFSSYNREALRDEIENTQAGFSELLLEGDILHRVLEMLPDVNIARTVLRENITVEVPKNSQLLYVRVRAPDPDMAALLTNTIVEVGLERYGELLASSTASTREFIEQELEVTYEELVVSEAELTQFQIQNKIGNLNYVINSQYELLRSLEKEKDMAQISGSMRKAQSIEEAIMEREFELQNLLSLSTEYNELVDRVERVRSTYNFLLDKKSEAKIKESQILELGSIQVITPARPPLRPVTVISFKIIVFGAVVSILAGGLLTFLLGYLEVSGAFQGLRSPLQQSEVVAGTAKQGQ